MLLPVILILLALLAASALAYGTEPSWASYGPHGIDVILWSRRLQWPIVFTAIILCLILLGLVISNKKRAWWLIGLMPVLALFYHRVTDGPAAGLRCVQDLPMTSLADAGTITDSEMIVGLMLDSQPCAIPYSTLSVDPVLIYGGREKPVVLFWSSAANRAQAFTASRDLRAADLEVVSTIDNALVVFNTRLGEFINGLTGRTFRGEIPTGIHQPVNVVKCTWQAWMLAHPDTKVMQAPVAKRGSPQGNQPADSNEAKKICVVACTQPIAVPSELITDHPLNLTAGQTSLLLVRINGVVKAYSRQLPEDLIPRFFSTSDPKHKTVAWMDSDTNSQWSNAGEWVAGPKEMHGISLTPIAVEDDLYWNVMKFWYPDLHLATDAEISAATAELVKKVEEKPVVRRRKNQMHG